YRPGKGTTLPPSSAVCFAGGTPPVPCRRADAYTSFARWFGPFMGPTFPNRWYLHSGQSGGYMYNDFMPMPLWPTIYDRLDAAGVSWTYYYTDLPFLLTMGVSSTKWAMVDQFLTVDAPMGRLPSVAVVDPGFGLNADDARHHALLGQQFIASIYTALAKSPHWENSLMVVTYDEHGGFFDHVAPPKAPDERAAQGFDQLGFRVPTLAMGPYVRKGYVSSVVHDHTSVLKQIEKMFGLQPLTMRDAAANDLSDAIDADRLASGDADAPITLPQVMVDISTLPALCTMSDFKPSDIELMADRGLIPTEIDRRPY